MTGIKTFRDFGNLEFLDLGIKGFQGGDSAAGTQALPVGKIIDDKVYRKHNQKVITNLHMLKDI